MKDLIKRLRSLIAKATTPETIIKRDEACVANTSQLLDYIEKLEARLADAEAIRIEYCESIGYIEKLEKLEGNYRKMITEVIECHPQRVENGENELPWELVKRIRLENEKLEATIAKHERREDSHMKQIEELISGKGIKELEARLADAEAHAADFKAECDEKDKVIECITNVALQVIVEVREKEREAIAKMAESFGTVTVTGRAFAEVVRNRSNKDT